MELSNIFLILGIDFLSMMLANARPMKPAVTSLPGRPFVGDNITFTCNSTQSWPARNITSKLSYHFVGNARGETDNNQLTIHTLTKLDKGKDISCQYTDELGVVSNMSETITLDPYYGPEHVVLDPGYTNINVTEGTILGPINCTANCNPDCTYNWKHKAEEERFELILSIQTLTIPDIKKSQTGIYRCRIDHPFAKAYYRTDISVNVQYSPKIKEIWFDDTSQLYRLSSPNTFNFSEDVNLQITLRIESNPPNPKIMFNSSSLEIQYSIKGNGYIDYQSILSLNCEDSGEFTIRAINGISNGDTRKVNLTILCKPRSVTTESRKIETKIGSTENIVMYVVSSPLPTVEWCRVTGYDWIVKTEIYDYRYEISSKIHVRSELDFGVYGIRICNLKGCIKDNVTLTPLVNISWIAGFNGGNNQTFSVQFKTTDSEILNSTTVHTNETKRGSAIYLNLDQNKPDTSYEVMVLSTNIHGSRNASLEFKTKVELNLSSSSKSAAITWLWVGLGCGISLILVVIFSLLVFKTKRNKDKRNESRTIDAHRTLTDTNDHSEIETNVERHVDRSKMKMESKPHEDHSKVIATSDHSEITTGVDGYIDMGYLKWGPKKTKKNQRKYENVDI